MKNSRARIEKKYQELCREFPEFFEALEEKLACCREREALAMRWMYAAMPWSDRENYPFEVFLDFAGHGVWLWEHKASVRELPEELFLNYVLCHRVNEEEIRPCRRLFYGQLKEGLEGLTEEQAALEVNEWCAGEAAYQATDERTLSALAVYERGNGRCGEESTFVVNAMRSAGIPARQVYAPRWSHCDDNHAWVEVWVNGRWQFTGACEPEPVLNKGWFNGAASRAMMIHARWFDYVCPQGEEIIGKEGMVTMLNELRRYAPAHTIELTVCEAEQSPAEGARVWFEVLNYAEYVPVAEAVADAEGKVRLTVGAGTLHIWAQKEEKTGELFWDVQGEKTRRLLLHEAEREYGWRDCDMLAPEDRPAQAADMEHTQPGAGKRLRAKERRREKKSGWENPERKSFLEYLETLEKEKAACGRALLDILTEKDQTDCRMEVLKDHLEAAYPYRRTAPPSIFVPYVLNPRVEQEVLTPYRGSLLKQLSAEEQKQFREEPELLWERISRQVKERPKEERESLITAPDACLKYKIGSRRSKKVLFVAAARTLGLPARLNPEDGTPEYWKNGRFIPVSSEKEKDAALILHGSGETVWKYFQNWSIACRTEAGWRSLHLAEKEWTGTEALELCLPAGDYRIITANRLPNGNQFARQRCFSLAPKERRELTLTLREAKLSDMLEEIEFPDFRVRDVSGANVSASALTEHGCRALIWLDEGQEPTEHILNEMLAQTAAFQRRMEQMIFVVRAEGALRNPTVQSVLRELPGIAVYYDDFSENVYMLGRRMYVDHEKLPLILVTDGRCRGIYAASGYNVGAADMLLKIMEAKEQEGGCGR